MVVQDDQGSADKPKDKLPTGNSGGRNLWVKTWSIIFLLCLVALIVALLLSIGFGRKNGVSKYVDTSAYQAVEVRGASTPTYYFGNISYFDGSYLVLNNALTLTSKPDSSTVVVAPLACTSPNDSSQLIVNLSQVVMWDNLASDSPAVQAINQASGAACPTPTADSAATATPEPTGPANVNPGATSQSSADKSGTSSTTSSDSTSSPTSSSTTTSTSTTPNKP